MGDINNNKNTYINIIIRYFLQISITTNPHVSLYKKHRKIHIIICNKE